MSFYTPGTVKMGQKTGFSPGFSDLARVFWIGTHFFERCSKKVIGSRKRTKNGQKSGQNPTEPYRKVALYALMKNFRKKVRF